MAFGMKYLFSRPKLIVTTFALVSIFFIRVSDGKTYRHVGYFGFNVTNQFGLAILPPNCFQNLESVQLADTLFEFKSLILNLKSKRQEENIAVEKENIFNHILNSTSKSISIIIAGDNLRLLLEHVKRHKPAKALSVLLSESEYDERLTSTLQALASFGIKIGVIIETTNFANTTKLNVQKLCSVVSCHIYVEHVVKNEFFDYDTFSRYLDTMKHLESKNILDLQLDPEITFLFRMRPEYFSICKQNECLRFEKLIAKFVYIWGLQTEHNVAFEFIETTKSNKCASVIYNLKKFSSKPFGPKTQKDLIIPQHLQYVITNFSSLRPSISNDLQHILISNPGSVYKFQNMRRVFEAMESDGVRNKEPWLSTFVDIDVSALFPRKKPPIDPANLFCKIADGLLELSATYPENVNFIIFRFFCSRRSKNTTIEWPKELTQVLKQCLIQPLEARNISFAYSVCKSSTRNNLEDILSPIMSTIYTQDRRIRDSTHDLETLQAYLTTLNDDLRSIGSKNKNAIIYINLEQEVVDTCFFSRKSWYAAHNLAWVYGAFRKNTVFFTSDIEHVDAVLKQMQKEECVIMERVLPQSYFHWHRSAGVSLSLGGNSCPAHSSSLVLKCLLLTHTKFVNVEVNFKQLDQFDLYLTNFAEARGSMNKENNHSEPLQFKYFANLGDPRKFFDSFGNPVIGTKVSINTKGFDGVHFDLIEIQNENGLGERDLLEELNGSGESLFWPDIENSSLLWPDVDVTENPANTAIKKAILTNQLTSHLVSVKNMVSTRVGFIIECKTFFDMDQHLTSLLMSTDYVVLYINVEDIHTSVGTDQSFDLLGPQDPSLGLTRDFSFTFLIHDKLQNALKIMKECQRINPNITVFLKSAFPVEKKWHVNRYLRYWLYFDELSAAHGFTYFIHEAFDDSVPAKYGWWRASELTNSTNGFDFTNYIERESEFFNLETNYPKDDNSKIAAPSVVQFQDTTLEISLGLSASLIVVAILGALIYRVKKRPNILKDSEVYQFRYGMQLVTDNLGHIFGEKYNEGQYEVKKNEFQKEKSELIGSGNFGEIYKTRIARFDDFDEVAIKVPKPSQSDEEFVATVRTFLREIKIMSCIGKHENILQLLGAYTKEVNKGVVFVVIEFCPNGCLIDHLRDIGAQDRGSDMLYELFRYCGEIANGMAHLANLNIIHADLSARNVLLDQNRKCKISDFGLSKALEHYKDIYVTKTQAQFPWAWMAAETLNKYEFTPKSDVWSMGVTFWEIFTLGKQPYARQTFSTDFVDRINHGMVLSQPELVSNETFEEILKCWKLDPEMRPSPSYFCQYFQGQRDCLYVRLEDELN